MQELIESVPRFFSRHLRRNDYQPYVARAKAACVVVKNADQMTESAVHVTMRQFSKAYSVVIADVKKQKQRG